MVFDAAAGLMSAQVQEGREAAPAACEAMTPDPRCGDLGRKGVELCVSRG